jgi:hypothetical protein
VDKLPQDNVSKIHNRTKLFQKNDDGEGIRIKIPTLKILMGQMLQILLYSQGSG